jgi:ATP-dependent DNA helicase PIF1
MTVVPSTDDPNFEKIALAQLRLYKPFRHIQDLQSPTVSHVFMSHLRDGGFPDLISNNETNESDDGAEPAAGVTLVDNIVLDNDLQQDDYQLVMNASRVHSDSSYLLGMREADIVHRWPDTWANFSFNHLLSWLPNTKNGTIIQNTQFEIIDYDTLSETQHKAFELVFDYTFGRRSHEQLLMIVIGTAGTGKSYLINSLRQLFVQQQHPDGLKITAPTGIAAANIYGCTIFSLLNLMNEDVNAERLLSLQNKMKNVKLLIIDEYSFLSIAIIDRLDRRLRKVFCHHSDVPFGGLNILLCGDPAQLPPVRALPVYAYEGSLAHLAARFHLFDKVVELDQPFRQIGNDLTQIRFRAVLARVANCEPTLEDWKWLQTRTSTFLTAVENGHFENCRHVVATNDVRNRINRQKLSTFSPIIKIDDGDENSADVEHDKLEGNFYDTTDPHLFAIGADVMLTTNLWTEAGLVNGSSGRVVSILKPQDARKARILLVDFPAYRGPALLATHKTVVPITQVRVDQTVAIPLTLAWAITIHKSQGMSLDHVTVDLGSKEFSSGLSFVALSRARRISGLRILPFDYERFKRIASGKYVSARRSEFRRLRLLAASTS